MKTKNTKIKLFLSLIIILSVIFTSCNSNDDSDIINPVPIDNGIGNLDQGQNIQRNFMGRIVDDSNVPIEDALVTVGSKVSMTDVNGMFIITNANVKERQAFIVVEKTGYLKGMRTVVPSQGTNMVRLILLSENIVGSVASGSDSQVNLPNGTTVKFDGAFEDKNGNLYTGNVDVIMYHLDPSNTNIDAIMPGSLQAQNSNGEERVLETFGMLNVELRGVSGEELNIADGLL